jgi:hypothetical protein
MLAPYFPIVVVYYEIFSFEENINSELISCVKDKLVCCIHLHITTPNADIDELPKYVHRQMFHYVHRFLSI